MRKALIGIIIVIIAGGIAFGLYEYNREPEGISSMKVDVEIEADELIQSFIDNEAEANEKYLDKVLLVKGKVSGTEDKDEKKSIFMETNEPLSNIIFQLEDYKVKLPEVDEIIKIKGICTGYLMDVVLIKSKIEK